MLCSFCLFLFSPDELGFLHDINEPNVFLLADFQDAGGGEGLTNFFDEYTLGNHAARWMTLPLHPCAPGANHFMCDVCGRKIVGTRFHSLVRDNYDECETCRQKSLLPERDFEMIEEEEEEENEENDEDD